MNDSVELTERRSGISVTVEIKRGSGTRDQDKLSATLHADTIEQAHTRAEEARELLRAEAEELRSIQPEADGDE